MSIFVFRAIRKTHSAAKPALFKPITSILFSRLTRGRLHRFSRAKSFAGCLFLLACSSLRAASITSLVFDDVDRGWNSEILAKMYFHHSETQRQWAWELLSRVPLSGHERVLDFGCGDGKISSELSRLVRSGSVLGVDVSEKMIHMAKIHFPQYAFPNLTFQNSQSVTFSDFPGEQEYDLVCAFTVFHLVREPLKVLKNLHSHLKAKGKLLLTIPTGKNEILYQAAGEIFPKYGLETPWSKSGSSGGCSMRTLEGCASLLQESGFIIESMEIIDIDNSFYDLEDLITWLVGTASATWQIPSCVSQVFFTDLVYRMYELHPAMIDDEGRVRFKMPRMHVIATPAERINR